MGMAVTVVENHIDKHYRQHDSHTDCKDCIADMGSDHRADDITYNSRQGQLNAALYIEHTLTDEGNRRGKVLQNNGYTIRTVSDSDRQAQNGKERHSDNSAAASQRIDNANQNT
jgi:hypothetical protein